MRVLPAGERAFLLELGGLDEVISLSGALRTASLPGVVDLVPAARTVLIHFDPAQTSVEALRRGVAECSSAHFDAGTAAEVVVPVHYDGADLEDVARRSGLAPDEVARVHAAGSYRVAFCGFAPGFAYLAGLDARLVVPRLERPRTAVPAGAVAIADEFTAIYPRRTPGGWRIIGHTDFEPWDLALDPPSALTPGTPVRFIDAGAR